MSDPGRQKRMIGLSSVALISLVPSVASACTITHSPKQSTDKLVAVDVRMKPGERCVIQGGKQEQPWFRRGEKMSAYKGQYGRLVHELYNEHDPRRARWQYVYVSPRGWVGQDSVSIYFAVPAIEIRYEIVVQ